MKKLNWEHLAGFIPLTVLSYSIGGITPTFLIATFAGLSYVAWQVIYRE